MGRNLIRRHYRNNEKGYRRNSDNSGDDYIYKYLYSTKSESVTKCEPKSEPIAKCNSDTVAVTDSHTYADAYTGSWFGKYTESNT